MAEILAKQGRGNIEFDLCGAGAALRDLRLAIDEAGLHGRVRCHGHCDQQTMAEMYSRCHVVIVPTTTDFIEGFNKVVAEGVLAGRPVITSSVCPALGRVRNSVVEVPADDVPAYADAIARLHDDAYLYQAKRCASAAAQEQFYNPANGWAAALKSILATFGERGIVSPTPAPSIASTSQT
jgi:glycosyltransferase involved in cell wall biosynthesis